MFDPTTFPVAHCGSCARDVLVAKDLDANDAWVDVCTRCGDVLEDAVVRRYASTSMGLLGYDVDGAAEGCGGGGCGSCGTTNPAPSEPSQSA